MPRGLTRWDLLYASALVLGAPAWMGAWACSPRLRASLDARRRNPPPELPAGQRAWIHGASVGEILSAGPVIDALGGMGLESVLSVNTPTGLEAARKAFPGRTAFCMPLDFSGRVTSAFDRLKPSLLVLLELEVWPQLLKEAERRRIPVACVNARITERSFRRYRKLLPLIGPSFRRVALYLAQGQDYAGRLAGLGVPQDRVKMIPNLKASVPPPTRPDWIPEGAPLLVGGSTHPGEEEALIEAWRGLVGWRLLLAPRHPQRFDEVAGLLRAKGVPFTRRSSLTPGWTICLLDTIGELKAAYAAGAMAFVGGTLAPVGGHNVLEPASCGVPVLVGPHTEHVKADADALEAAGGLLRISTGNLLPGIARELAGDPERRRRMGESARSVLGQASREPLREALRACLST